MSLDADPFAGLDRYGDFGLDIIWEPEPAIVEPTEKLPDALSADPLADAAHEISGSLVRITERKACGDDPYTQSAMFLTASRGSKDYDRQREVAKSICRQCEALDQCLELAANLPVDTGFYNAIVIAGMDTTERARYVLAPEQVFRWSNFPVVDGNASHEERQAQRMLQREAIIEACVNLFISGGEENVTFDNVANVTGCSPSNLSDILKLLGIKRKDLAVLAYIKSAQADGQAD